jgi:hypothetical protein
MLIKVRISRASGRDVVRPVREVASLEVLLLELCLKEESNNGFNGFNGFVVRPMDERGHEWSIIVYDDYLE